MLRTVRNIAIILILAVPIAFVPGGGGIAQGVLALLLMAFLARCGGRAPDLPRGLADVRLRCLTTSAPCCTAPSAWSS